MLFNAEFDHSSAVTRSLNVTAELLTDVSQFLFKEAQCLDSRGFEDWLHLWSPEGMYWVPHAHEQSSPKDHISLFWEDATLREVRVRRVTNARNWSQQPATR